MALGALKDHLRIAQEKMKRSADQKRRELEYTVGDMVFLKIRPYRHVSLREEGMKSSLQNFLGPIES